MKLLKVLYCNVMYYTVPAQNCSASVTESRPPSSRSSASYSTTYLGRDTRGLAGHVDSRTKFREMFTIFGEGSY